MERRDIQAEIRFYSNFISPGDTVIDVGAHIGDGTLAFGVCAGPEGSVFAFEPNPATFRILADTAFINRKLVNIFPVPLALSTSGGQLIFDYGDYWLDNGGYHPRSVFSHGSNYAVPVRTVELCAWLREIEHVKGRLGFIKLDCEGSDLEIIQELIKRWDKDGFPVIQFELLELSDLNCEILHELSKQFYLRRLFVMHSGEIAAVDVSDVSSIDLSSKQDLLLMPKTKARN